MLVTAIVIGVYFVSIFLIVLCDELAHKDNTGTGAHYAVAIGCFLVFAIPVTTAALLAKLIKKIGGLNVKE